MGERKSSVLIPCITTLADVMMNALLTCVVSINNVKTAQDPDRGSCTSQMLGGNSDGWNHSNQPFPYRPSRSPPGAFRFCFLHNAQTLLDRHWVKASFDKLRATSHETSVTVPPHVARKPPCRDEFIVKATQVSPLQDYSVILTTLHLPFSHFCTRNQVCRERKLQRS